MAAIDLERRVHCVHVPFEFVLSSEGGGANETLVRLLFQMDALDVTHHSVPLGTLILAMLAVQVRHHLLAKVFLRAIVIGRFAAAAFLRG